MTTPAVPTPRELYERARERDVREAEFHARVRATAQLLKVEPSLVRTAVHAADLATELLDLSRSLNSALDPDDVLRVAVPTSLLVRAESLLQALACGRIVATVSVQPSMLDEARELAEAFRRAASVSARR